jgi:hypothetical protein
MRMLYTRRKAKLLAAGVQPTLRHILFLRRAIGRAVSLQRLIESPGGDSVNRGSSESKLESPLQSSAAVAGAVDFEAIRAALAQQLSAEMREVRESNGRAIAELQRELRGMRECNDATQRMHAELLQVQQAVATLTAHVHTSQ